MADPQYTYIGYAPLAFGDYVDTATGKMLMAEPGESYGIRAVNEGAPVPPADGRWDPPWVPPAPPEAQDSGSGDGKPPAPPGVPPVPPVPPLGAEEVTA